MKKIILTILMLTTMAVGASAKFRWGPTAGVNFGNLYWNQRLIPSDMTVGYRPVSWAR